MKLKVWIVVTIMITAFLLPILLINAQGNTVVSLSPSVIPTDNLSVGSTFNVVLHVSDVQSLWMWSAGLKWNASILELQGSPVEGSFLKSAGGTLFVLAPVNNTGGILPEMTSTLMSVSSANGTGDLANFTFKVKAIGNTEINIINPVLVKPLDESNQNPPITFTFTNSSLTMVSSTSPTPTPSATPLPSINQNTSHPPVAKFLPADGASYVKGDIVTLDASQSIDGYDILGSNESCPIVSYGWRVEYLNGTLFNSFSGKTVSFNATVAGDLRIILIVEAQDPHPPSSDGFRTSGTTTATIHIAPEDNRANIDVVTERGGVGQNSSSKAYGPQELVKVYATSTYRNVSVPNIDVAFTLKDSKGTDIAYRVARTNSSGIASAEFRLPWSDTANPESAFGNWSIVATATVSQYAVKDVVPFIFSYVVITKNVSTLGAVSLLAEVPINITVNSLSGATWSHLTVTVFDSQKQPIGSFVYANTGQTSGNITVQAKIKIPSWAYLDQAAVYVNVLTASPGNAGVPYCPETTVNFKIVN
jgi:hypothetical protein